MFALPQELQALFEGRFCLGVCFFCGRDFFSVCGGGEAIGRGFFNAAAIGQRENLRFLGEERGEKAGKGRVSGARQKYGRIKGRQQICG